MRHIFIQSPAYLYADKKENKIFLINKEILKGAVAKSYMTKALLIYDFATVPIGISLNMMENFIFFL
jgi:hypothetical protein